jgi:Na+/H+-translocating membrane pyrophosphatase
VKEITTVTGADTVMKIDIAMIQLGEEMMATMDEREMIVNITEEGIGREAMREQSGMICKGICWELEHQTQTLNVIEITLAIMLKRKKKERQMK